MEFASEKRREGLSIRESAAEAARLRFRAILMTAFSSILGFMPLLVASGAGAASRQAVGNAVVGGMIAATLFSLMFVPSFFVVFRWLGEFGQSSESPEESKATGIEKINESGDITDKNNLAESDSPLSEPETNQQEESESKSIDENKDSDTD